MQDIDIVCYDRHHDQLVQDHEGRWVVIHNGEVIGIWDAFGDACRRGAQEAGSADLLVRQITRSRKFIPVIPVVDLGVWRAKAYRSQQPH